MKRFVAIILLITCFMYTALVFAENDTIEMNSMLKNLNIINENSFSNPYTVTRRECIVAIMKVIGVTDEEVGKLNGADIIAFADTKVFSYPGCAYKAKIAFGEECVVDYSTDRTIHTLKNTDLFFFPEHDVTINEVLAFMVRCLENSDKNVDLSKTFEKAKSYSLIEEEDEFIQNSDFTINHKDFCILLERFLQQKRYKYYKRENGIFRIEGNIDEERSIKYLDMLQQG